MRSPQAMPAPPDRRHARRHLPVLLLAAAVAVATPAAASIRGTMHEWRTGARSIDSMLKDRHPFDAGAAQAVLRTYIADAAQIRAQVGPHTATGKAFLARLAAFDTAAKAALATAGRKDTLTAGFAHVTAACAACHDTFKG